MIDNEEIIEGRHYVDVSQILFRNKQNIPWNDVEKYLKNT